MVVVGLGTNYLVSTGQLNELMQILGPQRRLVLINTYVPDSWSKQVNATEAAFIRAHPSVVPADWFDTIKNRMNLLWPDHVHPIIPGTLVYARLVYRAIQATRDVPAPVSARRGRAAAAASAAHHGRLRDLIGRLRVSRAGGTRLDQPDVPASCGSCKAAP